MGTSGQKPKGETALRSIGDGCLTIKHATSTSHLAVIVRIISPFGKMTNERASINRRTIALIPVEPISKEVIAG